MNLLKSHERRPREMLLRQELATAIHLLNSKVCVVLFSRLLVRPREMLLRQELATAIHLL